MKRKRGSVMLFVVVMISFLTIGILSWVQLTTSAAQIQARREHETKARLAYEGAIQLALSEHRRNIFLLPSTRTYSVGDLSVRITATDNSSSLARTVKVAGEVDAGGKKHSFSRTVGNRKDPHPFYYAIFVNENFDPTKAVTLGAAGANGDLNVNGSIVARLNPFVINGDVESVGTTLPATASVTGNVFRGASAVPFPTFTALSYFLASPVSLLVNGLVNRVFPLVEPYQLLYRSGNLDLSGTFTGKGTIFVDGNVTITGNMSYGSPDSRLVVISTGLITVSVAATNIVGCYYTSGEFRFLPGTTSLTSGAVAAQRVSLSGGPINVQHDPTFWNDPQEAVKHRVPGFWP